MAGPDHVDVPEPPHIDVDLFGDDVLADPWPFYASIREAAPVVHIGNDLYEVYAISRFADVKNVLLTSLSRLVSSFDFGPPTRRLNNTTRGFAHLPATLVTERSPG